MKLRTLVKISITTSVALLCTGIAVFSFFKLTAAEKKEDFELYSLVPPSATGVLETDNMVALMQDIGDLDCSKDGHFLYVSKIFSHLKLHLHTLLEDTPHGFSRQMSKVLLSFHQPGNDRNQVLYCALGADDYELIGKFIRKYCSSTFPSKMFDYKGEEIRIYPLPDGDFLACYYTSRFLVVSYQKRLIEEVIDARLSKKSLLADTVFADMHALKKSNATATVYIRAGATGQETGASGRENDEELLRRPGFLGGWTEFDVKLSGDAIYFTGVNRDTADTCRTFAHMLRRQQPVEGFPGAQLPVTTFFFSRRSVSDWQAMQEWSGGASAEDGRRCEATVEESGPGGAADEALSGLIKEVAGLDLTTCFFAYNDTTGRPAVVASFPAGNAIRAERLLKVLSNSAPREKEKPSAPRIIFCYTSTKVYLLYLLPCDRLFVQLTGCASPSMHVYAAVYGGRLLLAPDAESLTVYIHHLEKGEVLEGMPGYRESVAGLSDMYSYMLVSDLEHACSNAESYVQLLPAFFFRHPDFFRHFVLSAQFTCMDGVVYPNVVLQYKGE